MLKKIFISCLVVLFSVITVEAKSVNGINTNAHQHVAPPMTTFHNGIFNTTRFVKVRKVKKINENGEEETVIYKEVIPPFGNGFGFGHRIKIKRNMPQDTNSDANSFSTGGTVNVKF